MKITWYVICQRLLLIQRGCQWWVYEITHKPRLADLFQLPSFYWIWFKWTDITGCLCCVQRQWLSSLLAESELLITRSRLTLYWKYVIYSMTDYLVLSRGLAQGMKHAVGRQISMCLCTFCMFCKKKKSLVMNLCKYLTTFIARLLIIIKYRKYPWWPIIGDKLNYGTSYNGLPFSDFKMMM